MKLFNENNYYEEQTDHRQIKMHKFCRIKNQKTCVCHKKGRLFFLCFFFLEFCDAKQSQLNIYFKKDLHEFRIQESIIRYIFQLFFDDGKWETTMNSVLLNNFIFHHILQKD